MWPVAGAHRLICVAIQEEKYGGSEEGRQRKFSLPAFFASPVGTICCRMGRSSDELPFPLAAVFFLFDNKSVEFYSAFPTSKG